MSPWLHEETLSYLKPNKITVTCLSILVTFYSGEYYSLKHVYFVSQVYRNILFFCADLSILNLIITTCGFEHVHIIIVTK